MKENYYLQKYTNMKNITISNIIEENFIIAINFYV